MYNLKGTGATELVEDPDGAATDVAWLLELCEVALFAATWTNWQSLPDSDSAIHSRTVDAREAASKASSSLEEDRLDGL